jgi:patatin-like phospholipase/acyl hydrolase
MFDLIVGTSTGGIISLALAMTNASITEMETFFRESPRSPSRRRQPV